MQGPPCSTTVQTNIGRKLKGHAKELLAGNEDAIVFQLVCMGVFFVLTYVAWCGVGEFAAALVHTCISYCCCHYADGAAAEAAEKAASHLLLWSVSPRLGPLQCQPPVAASVTVTAASGALLPVSMSISVFASCKVSAEMPA